MFRPAFDRLRLTLWCVITVWSILTAVSAAANGHDNAVMLVYHHVSNDTPPSTTISPQKFAEHLAYLHEHHQVVALDALVNALKSGQSLPDKAVAITFDDGYRNILENAHPMLMEYEMPYTIFINPGTIGTQKGQLSWDEVKKMSEEGVLFANHTMQHDHLLTRLPNETESQWLERTLADIDQAERMLKEHLGYSLKYLAYPFGEFNLTLANTLTNRGYIGFGQHSGAVNSQSFFGALSRFAAAGVYANLNSLKTKLNSLALSIQPPLIEPLYNSPTPPQVTLTIAGTSPSARQLTCFYNNKPIAVTASEQQFTFTLPESIPVGRSRVNCTAPSSKPGRFYWFSQPFFVADENGQFPN